MCQQAVPRLPCQLETLFSTQLTWQGSVNLIKVLRCRFQQRFSTFSMLLVEGFSERGLFRHLSDYGFRVRNLEIKKLWGSSFFSKCSKFILIFKKAEKDWENFFCFRDNCIWIGIVKLPLLRTGYFSSTANMLTRSPKIWHVNKRDFFQLNFLTSDQWIW